MRTTTSFRGIWPTVLVSTLIVLIASMVLWGTPLLASKPQVTASPRSTTSALPAISAMTTSAVTAPLPTIAQPTAARAVIEPPAQIRATAQPDSSTGQSSGADAITQRALSELGCLAPNAHHDPTLDEVAVERATEPISPVSADSVTQIAERDGLRVVVGADALGQFALPHPRCGETLLFGIPPLDWLKEGARFGLGVVLYERQAAIVVVTR